MYSYIHIPFCRQKCLYCKFALTPRWQEAHIRKYLTFLEKEIRAFFVTQSHQKLQSIYFGGGTPSVLSVDQIAHIIGVFSEYCDSAPDIEITLEANPEDITTEFITGIQKNGVNRLSLGVQTLNVQSLATIGRSGEIFAYRALDVLEHEKFENVNVDFILGLPDVGAREAQENIQKLLDTYSCIKHVSVYMLEDEKYPLSWKELSLPASTFEGEFLSIHDLLLGRGFTQYELSNFARPGYESRHNQSYWTHKDYRGFGLSASSYLDGYRFTNAISFDRYYRGEKIDEEKLTIEQKNLEEAMFLFRTFGGIPRSKIVNTEKCERFLQEGYLRAENSFIFLNSTGIFLLDYIMSELL